MTPLDHATDAEMAEWDERSAIVEFDANIPRPEAERLARQWVLEARTLPRERR